MGKQRTSRRRDDRRRGDRRGTKREVDHVDGLTPGDRVSWNTSQGRTTGIVRRVLTRPTKVKGHRVAASAEHPEVLVESERSGQRAAHRPSALRRLRRRGTEG